MSENDSYGSPRLNKDVFFRSHVVELDARPPADSTYNEPKWPEYAVVFDTETTLDPQTQALLFGFYRVCRLQGNSYACVEEGVLYADDLAARDLDGDICEQIIKAIGGIRSIRIVARSPELLQFLNSLAHEDVEVESDASPSKKVRKAYAPYAKTLETVRRATPGPEIAKENFFNALINTKVLTVGLPAWGCCGFDILLVRRSTIATQYRECDRER